MRLSIRHNGNYIIEFNQLTIHGREAVAGYAFALVLRGGRIACETPLVISNINLSLSLAGPSQPIAFSCPASTQLIQCNQYSNNSEQIHFEVVLTREQVHALEDYRQESDLKINLGIKAIATQGGQSWNSFEQSDVSIPREQWLQALQAAGYRQTLLFEVPLPKSPDEFQVFITKAQEFIETGHYKDAVMQCRHLIEAIEKLRDDKQQAIDANRTATNRREREDMTAISRMLSLREHLKNVCHLGAHSREFFTRSQAKAVLGMTLSLIADPTIGLSEDY